MMAPRLVVHIQKQPLVADKIMQPFHSVRLIIVAAHYMQGRLLQIIMICFISTVTTFFITAWSVQLTIRLQNKWKGRHTTHE